MKAKYRVIVLGCLKELNTEKEVVEEYRKYLSTIMDKRQVMSFSIIYDDGGNRGAIVATGRQISVIAGGEEITQLVNKMRKEELNRLPMDYLTPEKLLKIIDYSMS